MAGPPQRLPAKFAQLDTTYELACCRVYWPLPRDHVAAGQLADDVQQCELASKYCEVLSVRSEVAIRYWLWLWLALRSAQQCALSTREVHSL